LAQAGPPDPVRDRSQTRLLRDMGLDTLEDCRPPVPPAGLLFRLMETLHQTVRGTVDVFPR